MRPDPQELSREQRRRLAVEVVAAKSVGRPLRSGLRVTLNFHPDRALGHTPIPESLTIDGLYRSQFETGTSNGGLTAHPGGDRWRWESRVFGRAYDDGSPQERPKYGALNFRGYTFGAAPRFGSAHFRLGAGTLELTRLSHLQRSPPGCAVSPPLLVPVSNWDR